ncbi:MAG: GIY-YIG nuclease family protein [Patescibacteria group bacterium]
MYYVYAIFNQKHDKIYIGQTEDLNIRIEQHNCGFFKKCYTASFDGMWTLVYSEVFETREDALKREKQLKSFRGREFIRNKIKLLFSDSSMVEQPAVNR